MRLLRPPLSPWLWVPSLYLVESIPNGIVESVAPVFLQDLGVEKGRLTGIVAAAALPWALKPLWSPAVDLYRTKRLWVWGFQAMLAGALGLLAALVFCGAPAAWLPLALGALAFLSATHDAAADGFYLHGLDAREQSRFVGIRNAAYRVGPVLCQGALVGAAGALAVRAGWSHAGAWAGVLAVPALVMAALAAWHRSILPRPASDIPANTPPRRAAREYFKTWAEFFNRRGAGLVVVFLLLFRLSEVQLTRVASVFLKDPRAAGGLALDNESLALVNGTLGVLAQITGGILGGLFVARHGLRRTVWPLVFMMHTPNLAFIALARWQPESLLWTGLGVVVEKFGYGLGYTVLAVVMLRFCGKGERRAAHFAFATGLAYLGYVLPGFWAGALLEYAGYERFFWWVMLCTLPGFMVTALVARKIPAGE
jgi:PAT family beta-lactamase induction signal transducer AmpG